MVKAFIIKIFELVIRMKIEKETIVLCDNCKNNIPRIYDNGFDSAINIVPAFSGEKKYDFCDIKCLKKWVSKAKKI